MNTKTNNLSKYIQNPHLQTVLGLIFLAILLRLPFLPSIGCSYDMGYWWGWAKGISDAGLHNVYEQSPTDYVNYPPLMMYILLVIGWIFKLVGGTFTGDSTPLYHIIVKIPALLGDIGISLLVFYVVRRVLKQDFKSALIAFCLYLFNPFVWYNSAYWGQVDVLNTFFVFSAIILAWKKRFTWAWILFGLGILIKLQVIMILPALGMITVYKSGILKTIQHVLTGAASAFVGASYFILYGKLPLLLKMYHDLVNNNKIKFSWNAYNLWWWFEWNESLGPIHLPYDNKFLLAARISDVLLFSLVAWAVIWWLGSKKKIQDIFLFCAFLCLTFFTVPVAVHERYMYSFFCFFLIFVFAAKKRLWAYILLSITFLFNLTASLTPPLVDPEDFKRVFPYPNSGCVVSIITVGMLLYLAYVVARRGRLTESWKTFKGLWRW